MPGYVVGNQGGSAPGAALWQGAVTAVGLGGKRCAPVVGRKPSILAQAVSVRRQLVGFGLISSFLELARGTGYETGRTPCLSPVYQDANRQTHLIQCWLNTILSEVGLRGASSQVGCPDGHAASSGASGQADEEPRRLRELAFFHHGIGTAQW